MKIRPEEAKFLHSVGRKDIYLTELTVDFPTSAKAP